jgi:phage repressor protein C with HTH and peptisase S24 domain
MLAAFDIQAIVSRIETRLDKVGISAREACKRAGLGVDAIRDIRRGAKGDPRYSVTLRTMAMLAPALETTPSWLLEGTGPEEARDVSQGVPVVGYVGAGREAHFYDTDQGPFEYVEDPDPSADLSAVRVKGDSMRPEFFDGWLLYFSNDRQTPIEEVLARKAPAIVGLDNGKILVKRVQTGAAKDRFNLLSTNEDPIYNQKIEWACRIRWIVPSSDG